MIIVNVLGAPASGKSTAAAQLFSRLKELNCNCELIQEEAKLWCIEGKEIGKYGQFYLFGVECHNQSRLFNAVDIGISDSSPILAAFYNYYYSNKQDNSVAITCREFYKRAKTDNVEVVNFLLPRRKKYVTKGRYQTEEEAKEVEVQLQEWLDSEGYEYHYINCSDSKRINTMLGILQDIAGDFDGLFG